MNIFAFAVLSVIVVLIVVMFARDGRSGLAWIVGGTFAAALAARLLFYWL